MNFLITNMTGFRNKGCEATTKAIVNEIIKLENNAKFKILTEDVKYDSFYALKYKNLSFLKNPFRRWYFFNTPFLPTWWQYRLMGKLKINASIGRALEAFYQADAVLSTGGDVFSSIYKDLLIHLAPLKVAASFGKPIVLLGHSIGPFEKEKEKKVFIKAMENIQLITVRESLSLKYLKNMKLKNARIELTADPAICLETDIENIEQLFKIYNITEGKNLVGVAPSQGIARYSKISYQRHFNALRELITFLIKKFDCHVILIPHVHESYVENDDSVICGLLFRKLGFSKDVTVISLSHSAEEIRALVSKLDFLIAERMHAAIAALSQNVPVFVIGYSVKAEGILGDIFGFDSLDDYMISIKEIDEEKLKERIKKTFDRRDEVAKYLFKAMPRIKERARRNFTLTMEVLNKNM